VRRPLRIDATLFGAIGLILLGVVGVAAAGWIVYDAWSERAAWDGSPEAAALARQEAAPTPIWIPDATPVPLSADIQPLPTREIPSLGLAATSTDTPVPEPTPTVVVVASDLSVDAMDFRFLDPPEPGAHARLAVSVTNHSTATSDRILLGIPQGWFDSYSIIGTGPAVSADKTTDDGIRTFSFPPIAGGATLNLELHVTSMVEGTEPPKVSLLLPDGSAIGENDDLSTSAPTPRPGPVMGIEIPRLKLKTGVVQTAWEPPPFAVGQIRGSAFVTKGNSVLVGHLTGAAGNVFAHLDELEPGDEITATSRGLPYNFVVSRIFTSANNDPSPIAQDDDDDQITLMTCAGIWNPFTHDYSERLWVVAEPPEQAKETIARVAATATAVATEGVAATATAQVQATATAIASVPTATPTPVPFVGEPSETGGIGNHRIDLEKVLGQATGETSGKLVVFKAPKPVPGRPVSEVHVLFTPDPPRAALIWEVLGSPTSFDAAAAEAHKLVPTDARPRTQAPEGNMQFIAERFTSDSLGQALGTADFSVIYTRDAKGQITSILLGLGDDLGALIEQARR
jgi:LPXTG-site transpeptidase (sortase) family protein